MKQQIKLKHKPVDSFKDKRDRVDSFKGCLVLSLTGHDAGRPYLVLDQDIDSLYLVDGKYRPYSKPKRKSYKHVRVLDFAVSAEEFMALAAEHPDSGRRDKFIRERIKTCLERIS